MWTCSNVTESFALFRWFMLSCRGNPKLPPFFFYQDLLTEQLYSEVNVFKWFNQKRWSLFHWTHAAAAACGLNWAIAPADVTHRVTAFADRQPVVTLFVSFRRKIILKSVTFAAFCTTIRCWWTDGQSVSIISPYQLFKSFRSCFVYLNFQLTV